MNNIPYHLAITDTILSHFRHLPLLARDTEQQKATMELHALIASGDYFSLLATKLDTLSESIKRLDTLSSKELAQLSDDLLYIQKKYKIIKKNSSDHA